LTVERSLDKSPFVVNSKIQKFKDSKIQRFKNSKIQGFKNSKIQNSITQNRKGLTKEFILNPLVYVFF